MPNATWRERAALKAATRERVRTLSSLSLEEYLQEAEAAAATAQAFLREHGPALREGRVPGTRAGFARLYREAHSLRETVAAASFVLDEEDPFHLFGATTDRLRRAFPYLSDEEARRYVIRRLHDFAADVEPALPLRAGLQDQLFAASRSYHRIVDLKMRTLARAYDELSDLLDLLARYAPVYAGVPDNEVAAFQALPLDRRLKLLEGTGALGRRS
ncbi:MAG TPA: hypothetical protein VNZ52_01675 [Candidatus Thermoplasmatota archaeon]|nr:hypothetical protein [Candidatus Thermoplasmatota archaeon]